MKLYLDDTRNAPTGYTLIRTYKELINILSSTPANEITHISLDHDLAGKKTGYDVCRWFVENDYWVEFINIHSANPVGVNNMIQLLDRYAPSNVKLTNIRQ